MSIDRVLVALRWLLTRIGVLYVLVALVALSFIDTKAVMNRIKIRRLNDGRPEMGQLVAFGKGEIPAGKVDWPRYQRYYAMVLKYMPFEDVSKMFLGICEHYAGDKDKAAWGHLRASAEGYPVIFWNLFNAGAMAFEQGDTGLAARYLEVALSLPPDKIEVAMKASVAYRQIMSSPNFDVKIQPRVVAAMLDARLILAAAYFYNKDYARSRAVALGSLGQQFSGDAEPFYFYAGASSLALGQEREAFALISKCVELKSVNPLVYVYAGQMLKAAGNAVEAASALKAAEALQARQQHPFPYAARLELRLF